MKTKNVEPATQGLDFLLDTWEASYRKAAKEDRLQAIDVALRRFLERPTRREKKRALDHTILMICYAAVLADEDMGNIESEDLLAMQTYRHTQSGGRYVIEFVDFGLIGRWLIVNDVADFPLKELLEEDFRFSTTCIEHISVHRVDGKPLSSRERSSLKRKILGALSFEGQVPDDAFDVTENEVRATLTVLQPLGPD